MAGKEQKEASYNKSWEAEIAAYDRECRSHEEEFFKKHIMIAESGKDELTEEENEVLKLYLNGVCIEEIAIQYKVELDVITGLMEIIKAKLSLTK